MDPVVKIFNKSAPPPPHCSELDLNVEERDTNLIQTEYSDMDEIFLDMSKLPEVNDGVLMR